MCAAKPNGECKDRSCSGNLRSLLCSLHLKPHKHSGATHRALPILRQLHHNTAASQHHQFLGLSPRSRRVDSPATEQMSTHSHRRLTRLIRADATVPREARHGQRRRRRRQARFGTRTSVSVVELATAVFVRDASAACRRGSGCGVHFSASMNNTDGI